MLPVLQPEPLWDIVEEHLDEAEFLWELWEHSLVSPKYTLAEAEAGPKARLDAHIDALVAHCDEVAAALLLPVLASETAEPTRVSAAATALLLSPGEGGVSAVVEALQANSSQRSAIARAIEVCDRADLPAHIGPFLHTLNLDVRDTLARVMVFKRRPLGELLTTLLTSDRPTAQVPGLQALLHEPATAQHRRAVLHAFRARDPEVREAAWTAAAVLRMPQVWPELRARALEPGCGHALLLLALRGDSADHSLLVRALETQEIRASALWALSFLGTPAAVENSIMYLEDPECRHLAGEVFSAATGLNLDDEFMSITAQRRHSTSQCYNAEVELPTPSSEAILRWWVAHHRTLPRYDHRMINGTALTLSSLQVAATNCSSRRQRAIDLAILIAT